MILARNAGWVLTGRLVAQGLAVLVTVLLARRLGLEGFAGYAVLAAFVWIANVMTTFGTDMVLVRDIASGGSIGRWRAAIALQVGLSLVAIVALWAIAAIVPWPTADGRAALVVLAPALLPMAVTSVMTAVLRGVGAIGLYAGVGVVTAGIQAVAVVALVRDGAPLVDVALTLAGGQVIAALLVWAVAARRLPDLRRAGSLGALEIVEMASASIRIGVLGLLGMLYQRGPIVALAAMAGPIGTAYLVAAMRVTEVSRTGHLALFTALFPAMASPEMDPRTLRRSGRVSLGAAALIAATLATLGPLAIGLLYGPDFGPAAGALAILGLCIVPSTAAGFRTLELLAAHREGAVLVGLGTGLGALAAGLALLVPAFGWVGGAWAILAAEVVHVVALVMAGREAAAVTTRRSAPAAVEAAVQ